MNDRAGWGESLEFRLLNDYQHDFPLCEAPFAKVAEECGCRERDVIDAYDSFRRDGRIARIGAVFAPRRVGASTLAAMPVPAARLAEVAAMVSARPEVNHNYEREHEFNLWFVATAASPERLAATLTAIETECGYRVLRLPLVEEYHIDLGFALDRVHGRRPVVARAATAAEPTPVDLGDGGQAFLAALQEGLPLCERPWTMLARRLHVSEPVLLARVAAWQDSGLIRRFGVVVRHRELGYTANAMLVHDIADDRVDEVGRRLGREPDVTLCYRRPRVLPHWRYNLFCMIHGRERAVVESRIAELRERHGLADTAHAVLFSKTRYKQRGARYADATA